MKQTKLITLLLTSLIVASTSQLSVAGNRPGAYVLTPSIGYYMFAKKRNIDNNAMPNFAVGYNIDKTWGIEAAYGRANSSGNSGNTQSVRANLYTVDGLYHLAPCGNFAPYLAAGVGALSLNPSPNNDARTLANINAGIGAQQFISDSIAIRAEARDLYTMSGGKNDAMLNLGVSFLLGGQ